MNACSMRVDDDRVHLRNDRGFTPKTDRSLCTSTHAQMSNSLLAKAKANGAAPGDRGLKQTDGLNFPISYSTFCERLHKAARDAGCDFPSLGPHTLRRANITWRQLVGGSAIETSMIAGHSSVEMTEQYTFVDLRRQDELTQAIQDRLAFAAGTSDGNVSPTARP